MLIKHIFKFRLEILNILTLTLKIDNILLMQVRQTYVRYLNNIIIYLENVYFIVKVYYTDKIYGTYKQTK